ncbi:hypothetical protein NTE09_001846 [Vibrio mimicus]
MCKKYPLIAMLLVGSASHSLMVSAATDTATMRFEGTIDPICSAVVVGGAQKAKSVLFGRATVDSTNHVHELQLGGNSPASVDLVVAPASPLTALKLISAGATTSYTPKIMSQKGTGNTYTGAVSYTGLISGEKVSVYLDAEGRGEALFKPGDYKYEVTATIVCP